MIIDLREYFKDNPCFLCVNKEHIKYFTFKDVYVETYHCCINFICNHIEEEYQGSSYMGYLGDKIIK